ncbi:MAG: hypothetical protein OXB88_00935 [Bacteriovoracales bacterium]|nr:hypothetical protein [Bacteriovoracales bacterium]
MSSPMEMTLTCSECGSAIHIHPDRNADTAKCQICSHPISVTFTQEHEDGRLSQCPACGRKDFYAQKDFNRKIGVTLFIVAAITSIWTYGLSFVALYLLDLLLFKKLGKIAICYNCQSIFRSIANMDDIHEYDHEMNDRIIYSGHDFGGRSPKH